MSTAATLTPERPLRVVWSPDDADQVRENVRTERLRWARFLTARNLVLTATRSARTSLADLVERLHLGAVLRTLSRTLGWLSGARRVLGQGLRTPGVVSALLWAATTSRGWAHAQTVAATTGQTALGVLTTGGRLLDRGLRLLGRPGRYVADRLHTAGSWVKDKAALAAAVTRAVVPTGAARRLITAVCRERAAKALVGRLFGPRWALVARIALGLGLVPAFLRQEITLLLTGLLGRTTAPSAQETGGPLTDPTPPSGPTPPAAAVAASAASTQAAQAGPVRSAQVVDLDVERATREELEMEELEQVMTGRQTYPAKRSQHAKRRR